MHQHKVVRRTFKRAKKDYILQEVTAILTYEQTEKLQKLGKNGKERYGYFKRQTNEIAHEKTGIWQRKGNLKRETESLLISTKNNAIRINYIKLRIDNTLKNSKYRLCKDRCETVNHILSEYSKQAQKDKIRHDWAGEVIYWELCKRLKFDLTDIWYIRKHESVPENDTHTII